MQKLFIDIKQITALLLAVLMMISLIACGNTGNGDGSDTVTDEITEPIASSSSSVTTKAPETTNTPDKTKAP